jgi:hypothetical protein
MTNQNDEQFEKAMAERLRSAFDSLKASDELADKIRSQSAGKGTGQRRFSKKLWQITAVAAAVLFIVLPLSFHLASIPTAIATKAQMVELHLSNHSDSAEFFTDADPVRLAEFFKEKLGFNPAMPAVGNGIALRGCCVAHFKGPIVGSYGVETPEGFVSIVVVDEVPRAIGMTKMKADPDDSQVFWKSSYSNCRMAATVIGEYTYCAVGLIEEDALKQMLEKLLP